MKKVTAPLLAAILAPSLLFVSAGPAQAAGACDNHYIQITNQWTVPPNDWASGVRAPIKLKTDGQLCIGGDIGQATANWVGIEDQAGTKLVQDGWAHDKDPQTGNGRWCRFWEVIGTNYDTNGPKMGHCGDDADLTINYWEVEEDYVVADSAYHFEPNNCGTSDWTTCNLMGDGPKIAAFSSTFTLANTESTSGCGSEIMGAGSSRVTFSAMEERGPVTGSYSSNSLAYGFQGTCSHYQVPTHSATQFIDYDDRN